LENVSTILPSICTPAAFLFLLRLTLPPLDGDGNNQFLAAVQDCRAYRSRFLDVMKSTKSAFRKLLYSWNYVQMIGCLSVVERMEIVVFRDVIVKKLLR